MESVWKYLADFWDFVSLNFDAGRDVIDLVIVTLGIYWLLLLIRGTRAVQILVGLVVLIVLFLASELFQFATLGLILDNMFTSAVLIIIVLFQHDIRRALARVGRGFFPSTSAEQQFQVVEEVVRATQALVQARSGALILFERETALADQVEAAVAIDAEVSKELIVALFLRGGPLHDGAAIIEHGRLSSAGSILPLTRATELPEGLGTRHRAAVGITEETDAVAVIVSEETGRISLAMSGELLRGIDGPRLRVVLREILRGERRALPSSVGLLDMPEPVASSGETETSSAGL